MSAAEAYMCGALVRDRQPRANTSPRTSSRTDIYLEILLYMKLQNQIKQSNQVRVLEPADISNVTSSFTVVALVAIPLIGMTTSGDSGSGGDGGDGMGSKLVHQII
ncbi:hypothetical protein I7I51_05550 [Histoplasma capsulatum]|uniref:Uncharacterized protein n=1 Tax=Ajellomyces capsulatus TaxID=5037 RepID=A0A8A1M995_AJECA|nr:hypothetical protein I7I51_05550 [Histoplasma capsulatum]